MPIIIHKTLDQYLLLRQFLAITTVFLVIAAALRSIISNTEVSFISANDITNLPSTGMHPGCVYMLIGMPVQPSSPHTPMTYPSTPPVS